MHAFRIRKMAGFFALFFVLFLSLTGCAGKSISPAEVQFRGEAAFEQELAALFDRLLAQQRNSPAELKPVAVMPALRTGQSVTRLEEVILERLAARLRQDREVRALSRRNWFEYREGRPLSGQAEHDRVTVYEVSVERDETRDQARVQITAAGSSGRVLPGVTAAATLDFAPGAPARKLSTLSPMINPFPEGLEEHPFSSVDRLAFSMAAELNDALQDGPAAGPYRPGMEEMRVQIAAHPQPGVNEKKSQAIVRALQQAVIANRDFTWVMSPEDFGPAFARIDFYRRHESLFDLEENNLTAGTVLLLVDIFPHRPDGTLGIALRALWRVDPLTDRQGDFIPTNVAGTYLTGFAAEAYLADTLTPSGLARPRADLPEKDPMETQSWPAGLATEAAGICFVDFPEVYAKRIPGALAEMPGARGPLEAAELCGEAPTCRCFRLAHEITTNEMEEWLGNHFRLTGVVPYRVSRPTADGGVLVRHTGGFD